MSTGYCHYTRKRLSTNIFDIIKLKILFHLNCDSPKYIAKLFSLNKVADFPEPAAQIFNFGLEILYNWTAQWLVEFNPFKTDL